MAVRKPVRRNAPNKGILGLSEGDYRTAVALAKEQRVTLAEAAHYVRAHRAASKGDCVDYKGE